MVCFSPPLRCQKVLKGRLMKKRPIKLCIALLVILVFCFSVISCGDNGNVKEDETTADTSDSASSLERDEPLERQSDTKSDNGVDLPIIWN